MVASRKSRSGTTCLSWRRRAMSKRVHPSGKVTRAVPADAAPLEARHELARGRVVGEQVLARDDAARPARGPHPEREESRARDDARRREGRRPARRPSVGRDRRSRRRGPAPARASTGTGRRARRRPTNAASPTAAPIAVASHAARSALRRPGDGAPAGVEGERRGPALAPLRSPTRRRLAPAPSSPAHRPARRACASSHDWRIAHAAASSMCARAFFPRTSLAASARLACTVERRSSQSSTMRPVASATCCASAPGVPGRIPFAALM